MKGLLINCALLLGAMLLFNMFWWPLVALFASMSSDIASVAGWIWLAGLVASGVMAAYLCWPLYESNPAEEKCQGYIFSPDLLQRQSLAPRTTKNCWKGYKTAASIIAVVIFTIALYLIGLPNSVILYLGIMSGICIAKRSLLGLILVSVVAMSLWWLLKGRHLEFYVKFLAEFGLK